MELTDNDALSQLNSANWVQWSSTWWLRVSLWDLEGDRVWEQWRGAAPEEMQCRSKASGSLESVQGPERGEAVSPTRPAPVASGCRVQSSLEGRWPRGLAGQELVPGQTGLLCYLA